MNERAASKGAVGCAIRVRVENRAQEKPLAASQRTDTTVTGTDMVAADAAQFLLSLGDRHDDCTDDEQCQMLCRPRPGTAGAVGRREQHWASN